jgi:hypothetical protein
MIRLTAVKFAAPLLVLFMLVTCASAQAAPSTQNNLANVQQFFSGATPPNSTSTAGGGKNDRGGGLYVDELQATHKGARWFSDPNTPPQDRAGGQVMVSAEQQVIVPWQFTGVENDDGPNDLPQLMPTGLRGMLIKAGVALGYCTPGGVTTKLGSRGPTNRDSLMCNMVSAMAGAGMETDPQNTVGPARAALQAQATQAGNAAGQLEQNQAASAIGYVASYMENFTVEQGNKWNILRDRIFVPIALLLLLPGAVLAQGRAIVAAGSPVLGYVNPIEGILRSIIAIFMIPGTALVVNYSIDLSNALTYAINSEYTRTFGTNMYFDALASEVRAFPVRDPDTNENIIDRPQAGTNPWFNPTGTFSPFEGLINNRELNPASGTDIAPQDRADEALSAASVAAREVMFGSNAMLATTWNVLCAFQMAYMYYLWFVGPIVAALWVWPMGQLRSALPNWIQGVVTLAFWSLLWNTVVLLMAAFKGVDETGTVMMTALNLLATGSVKYAFDFAGLVSSAGQQAGSMGMNMAQNAAQQSQGSGSGGGGQSRGGSRGSSVPAPSRSAGVGGGAVTAAAFGGAAAATLGTAGMNLAAGNIGGGGSFGQISGVGTSSPFGSAGGATSMLSMPGVPFVPVDDSILPPGASQDIVSAGQLARLSHNEIAALPGGSEFLAAVNQGFTQLACGADGSLMLINPATGESMPVSSSVAAALGLGGSDAISSTAIAQALGFTTVGGVAGGALNHAFSNDTLTLGAAPANSPAAVLEDMARSTGLPVAGATASLTQDFSAPSLGAAAVVGGLSTIAHNADAELISGAVPSSPQLLNNAVGSDAVVGPMPSAVVDATSSFGTGTVPPQTFQYASTGEPIGSLPTGSLPTGSDNLQSAGIGSITAGANNLQYASSGEPVGSLPGAAALVSSTNEFVPNAGSYTELLPKDAPAMPPLSGIYGAESTPANAFVQNGGSGSMTNELLKDVTGMGGQNPASMPASGSIPETTVAHMPSANLQAPGTAVENVSGMPPAPTTAETAGNTASSAQQYHQSLATEADRQPMTVETSTHAQLASAADRQPLTTEASTELAKAAPGNSLAAFQLYCAEQPEKIAHQLNVPTELAQSASANPPLAAQLMGGLAQRDENLAKSIAGEFGTSPEMVKQAWSNPAAAGQLVGALAQADPQGYGAIAAQQLGLPQQGGAQYLAEAAKEPLMGAAVAGLGGAKNQEYARFASEQVGTTASSFTQSWSDPAKAAEMVSRAGGSNPTYQAYLISTMHGANADHQSGPAGIAAAQMSSNPTYASYVNEAVPHMSRDSHALIPVIAVPAPTQQYASNHTAYAPQTSHSTGSSSYTNTGLSSYYSGTTNNAATNHGASNATSNSYANHGAANATSNSYTNHGTTSHSSPTYSYETANSSSWSAGSQEMRNVAQHTAEAAYIANSNNAYGGNTTNSANSYSSAAQQEIVNHAESNPVYARNEQNYASVNQANVAYHNESAATYNTTEQAVRRNNGMNVQELISEAPAPVKQVVQTQQVRSDMAAPRAAQSLAKPAVRVNTSPVDVPSPISAPSMQMNVNAGPLTVGPKQGGYRNNDAAELQGLLEETWAEYQKKAAPPIDDSKDSGVRPLLNKLSNALGRANTNGAPQKGFKDSWGATAAESTEPTDGKQVQNLINKLGQASNEKNKV